MKQYQIYRNIRMKAMIMGLSISFFALQMTGVIGSLLVIIFSFSLGIIFSAIIFNVLLYVALVYFTKHSNLLQLQRVFPTTISNKRQNPLNYD